MSNECSCNENKEVRLIYTCSGAANTGYLADAVARKLGKECGVKMTCLAGVGADLSGFIQSAKDASKNIVLDGCPVACGKKIFEKNNLSYASLFMTDFGVEKGKTEITAELIDQVAVKVAKEFK